MRALFVHTSGWVAVADQSDQFHDQAARCYRQAFAHYAGLMTTSLVLAESYALLRRALPTDRVLYWLDQLLAFPRVKDLPVYTSPLLRPPTPDNRQAHR